MTTRAQDKPSFSLTGPQLRLLRFISGYIQAKGYSPSFDEMAAAVGCSSKSSMAEKLAALEERGAIRRLPGRWRAIEVLADIPVPRAPDGAPLYFLQVAP